MISRTLGTLSVLVLILVVGIGVLYAARAMVAAPTQAPASAAVTRTSSPVAATQEPPTQVRWAVDRSTDAARPYALELLYDNTATGFRIVDSSGRVILRFPIAGSGVFAADSCLVKMQQGDRSIGTTYLLIDAATYEQFLASASTYRVEADSIAQQVVTLPLTDSGCRPK